MKFISDISKALPARIKKILWALGLHAFAFILFLVFVDIIIGGFVFYKYVFLVEQETPKVAEKIIKFDNNAYQSVLGELQIRQANNQGPAPATTGN